MSLAFNKAIVVSVLVAAFIGAGLLALPHAWGGSGQAEAEQRTQAARSISFDLDGDGVPEHSADRDTISPEQAAALADEYVTREEYESAIWAAFACIKDAGFEPLGEPNLNAAGTKLIYSFRDGTGAGMAMRDCILYHSTLVEITWVRQNRPSAQTLAAAEAALRECLVAGGANEAEVYAAESFMVFAGHYQHSGQCLRQVSIEFQVGWYAGD